MEIFQPGQSGGVTSINSLTGAITLAAGSNITLTPVGNTITIAATGGTITGADTQVLYFDGANNPAGSAKLTFNKTSGDVIMSTGHLRLGGADGSAIVDIAGATTVVQGMRVEGNGATALSFSTFVTADAFVRFVFQSDGKMIWGSGALAGDTNLYRSAADTLKTDDSLIVANTLTATIGALVGGTSLLSINGNTQSFQVQGTTLATGSMALAMFNATAGTGANLAFYRSKNAAIGSATVVAQNDNLGTITWYGAQQTGTFSNQNPAAQIRVIASGVVTSGAGADMPGAFLFYTTADNSGTLTARLVIDQNSVRANSDDGLPLGLAGTGFSDLFLSAGGVINWQSGNVTMTHGTNKITTVGMMDTSLGFFTGGYTSDNTLGLGVFVDFYGNIGRLVAYNRSTSSYGDTTVNDTLFVRGGGEQGASTQSPVMGIAGGLGYNVTGNQYSIAEFKSASGGGGMGIWMGYNTDTGNSIIGGTVPNGKSDANLEFWMYGGGWANVFGLSSGGNIRTNQVQEDVVPGLQSKRLPIYDASGNFVGFIPIYVELA